MNILLCTNSFENVVNGPAKFSNLVLEVNKTKNHQLRILTEDVQEPSKFVYKVSIQLPKALAVFSQFYRMFKYHLAALKINREYKIDVIVYNNALIGLWSALWFANSVGMINDDNNSSVSINKPILTYLYFKRLIFKQFEKLSVKAHKKIIVNSNYLLDHLKITYNISDRKLFKLYKSIELQKTTVNSRGHINNPVSILFVKADFVRGGIQDLAIALSLLDFQFTCIIIGPDEKFKHQVLAFFCKGDNVQVEFLGPQTQVIVRKNMQKSDIFCTPSRQEALGVSNLEALSMGLPVVSTRVGGIPEILDHGRNGWLAEPENPKSLAEQIKSCINNSTERKTKCTSGFAFSMKFDKRVMIDRFLEILSLDN